MSEKNFYDMSDEEFLRSGPPPVNPEADAAAAKEAAEREAAEAVETPNPAATTPETPVETVANQEVPGNTPAQVTEQATPAPVQPATPEVPATGDQPAPQEGVPPANPEEPVETPAADTPPNYEELYQQVMAPFKANGKTIELKDASEVRQLLQMGANYTKNMQQIAPQRKTLLALQQAGINDPETLNFLIDLHQKKPEAIAKLVSESGIEPVDIDTSTAGNYRAGNHTVTDQQVAFQSVLDEISSSDDGRGTIDLVQNWDETSKTAAFNDPKILSDFHAHRSSGIYEKVNAELERARVLGQIPANVPFVNAYGHVFNEMQKAGAFDEPKPAPTPVAVRVATPKPVVTNSQAASAAAPSAPSNTTKQSQPDWLSMDDKAFMEYHEKLRKLL